MSDDAIGLLTEEDRRSLLMLLSTEGGPSVHARIELVKALLTPPEESESEDEE